MSRFFLLLELLGDKITTLFIVQLCLIGKLVAVVVTGDVCKVVKSVEPEPNSSPSSSMAGILFFFLTFGNSLNNKRSSSNNNCCALNKLKDK
jgi:hypothetical protein